MADANCHITNCEWLSLKTLKGIEHVQPLLANSDISGIGVIIGFSITAYLTLLLLILHYVAVYDPLRTSSTGQTYANTVDKGILTYFRHRIVTCRPSRRVEVAMEKSVLILSDTQLITGLAILISAYSQLDCGISAYHWQIMVFLAWFTSFTFLSAMTFLTGYFQANNNMRTIRVCFMLVLASLLIIALLPTGSDMWLDLTGQGGGFYPSLSTMCYFKQLSKDSYTHRGPRFWSMVLSVFVVSFSYIHSGRRLFDPTSELTRRYLRTWPGLHLKHLLHVLEHRSRKQRFWTTSYLLVLAAFTSARAFSDLASSMLSEIIWLTFAIAWGTIKIWRTRAAAGYDTQGTYVGANEISLQEDSWSFGQILPLTLLLLPLLSMTQAYLDNDARALSSRHAPQVNNNSDCIGTPYPTVLSSIHMNDAQQETAKNPRNSTSRPIIQYSRHLSLHPAGSHTSSIFSPPVCSDDPTLPTLSPKPTSSAPHLPPHPYHSFTCYPWYNDQIFLLFIQMLVVTVFTLFVLNLWGNFLGISAFLRNRLFLIWGLGMVPTTSLVHLSGWYLAAWVVNRLGCEAWLKGIPNEESQEHRRHDEGAGGRGKQSGSVWVRDWAWWCKGNRIRFGPAVYWTLRLSWVFGLVALTCLLSLEIAGPRALTFDAG